MWVYPYVACVDLILLVKGEFLVWMSATSFLNVCWPLFPYKEVWLWLWLSEWSLDVVQCLHYALWLSLSCQGQGLLHSCWSRSPQICFWAVVWEVDRIGVLPLGEEPLCIPLSELFTNKSSLPCHLSSTVWAHYVNCCWHCSTLFLNLGNGSNWPWHLFKCCFHKITSTDPLKLGPRTAVITPAEFLWELRRQFRPWPSLVPTCTHLQSPQLLRQVCPE